MCVISSDNSRIVFNKWLVVHVVKVLLVFRSSDETQTLLLQYQHCIIGFLCESVVQQ